MRQGVRMKAVPLKKGEKVWFANLFAFSSLNRNFALTLRLFEP